MAEHFSTSTTQKLIWLISPYHTGSHAAWAKGYKKHSGHLVELLTMAGRFWKWRMQGGAIELANQIKERLAQGERPDLIIATDMVNLAVLQGLLRQELRTELQETPFVLYMHENQLTYPLPPGRKPDSTYAMINWTGQLCADHIFFNSHYHRESWFGELPKLLKHYPDYNHQSLIGEVQARSAVLPVGIECARIREQTLHQANEGGTSVEEIANGSEDDSGEKYLPPLVLWNQRWEYDKRPDLFFNLLYRIQDAGVDFRLAVAGESFRNVPDEFERARERLADKIVHWGYLDSYGDYIGLLVQSDLVISTAVHEFFGISILEAIVTGAFPLLPNRLSYPELIPAALHPACLYADEDALFEMTVKRLQSPRPAPPSLQNSVVERFEWQVVAENYDKLVDEIISSYRATNH